MKPFLLVESRCSLFWLAHGILADALFISGLFLYICSIIFWMQENLHHFNFKFKKVKTKFKNRNFKFKKLKSKFKNRNYKFKNLKSKFKNRNFKFKKLKTKFKKIKTKFKNHNFKFK